jgi:PAS domain S-box
MMDEQPIKDIEFDPDSGSESAVVYPLVADSGNRRVLTDWLTDHDSYRLAPRDGPVTEADCDICIADQEGFEKHRATLESAKSAAEPVLLPVLLLVSEWDSDFAGREGGELVDNVFVSTVDEMVSTPIRQLELEWRMQALLRLRRQSLELAAKQERLTVFRLAAEAAGHGIYITDADGRIEYTNPAFEEITGYSRDEVLGKTPGLLDSDEMPPEHFDELWETVSEGEVWEGELIDRRKSGERYIAYQTVAPITNDGDLQALVTVQTDITERVEAKRKLERHRDIVERLNDPIMLQDREGDFELLNEAVADYAGVPAEELRGEDEFLFMDEETAARIDRQKSKVLEREEPIDYGVMPTFELNGEQANFSTTRYPYYDRDDNLAGTIAICRNVTDLQERTQQLRVIDTILRHNLRNSLTVIGLLAEQLQSRVDGALAEIAGRILESAQDLRETGEKSRAITSVLADQPTRGRVDIADAVRSVVDVVREDWPDANLAVSAPERATAITTLKIDEAIEELVRNALDHSDRETPTVEVQVETGDDAITVYVVDDGPGMSEMDRDVLRLGAATDDLYHGSGLGLWLVYWIVSRASGTVTVDDLESRGTRVTVRVPRHSEG